MGMPLTYVVEARVIIVALSKKAFSFPTASLIIRMKLLIPPRF